MKKVILGAVAAAAMALGGAAYANDFNNTQSFVDVEVGKFTFGIENREQTGFDSLELDYELFAYPLGAANSTFDIGLTYYDLGETVTLDAKYEVVWAATNSVDLYGSGEVNYVASSQAATIEGDWILTPEVGLEVHATDMVGVFGEVSYGFNATDSARDPGGRAELGLNLDVADNITFVPSVVHYFDGAAADRTEARVGLKLNF